jgi:hypothetical protein
MWIPSRGLLLLLSAACTSACGSPPSFSPASLTELNPPTRWEGAPPAPRDATSAPPAAASTAPDAAAAPPVEAVPETLGTPASSLAAAPAFWRKKSSAYAPALESPLTIFDAASAANAPGVAIACRLSAGRYKEDKIMPAFDKADLMVTATFGEGKGRMTFHALGPEDTNEIDFVLPLLPLAEGKSVAVSLTDRDVFSNDNVARFTITHRSAAPLTIRAASVRGECRSVPRAVIEASFQSARTSADNALAEMALERPDITQPSSDVGRPSDGLGAMTYELQGLAALVGWDDPRVVRRVGRALALRGSQAAEIARQAALIRAALPSPAGGATPMADGALEVRATKYECGPNVVKAYLKWMESQTERERLTASGCVAHFEVRSRTAYPIELHGSMGSSIGPLKSLGLISKAGFWFRLDLFAEVKNGAVVKLPSNKRRLRLGEAAEVVGLLYKDGSDEKPEPPLLLRGMHNERTSASAAEWTSMAGGKLQVRAVRVACDQAAAAEHAALIAGDSFKWALKTGGCVLRLEVRNTSGEPIAVDSAFGLRSLRRLGLIAPSEKAGDLDVIGRVYNGTAVPLGSALTIGPSRKAELVVATNNGGFPAETRLDNSQLVGAFSDLPSFARVE